MHFSVYAGAVEAIYRRFDRALALPAGATDSAIASVEIALGVPPDSDLWAAWREADGSGACSLLMRPGFPTSYEFLSVAEAIEERAQLDRIVAGYEGYADPEPRDPRIRSGWFHPGWVPFAGFGSGTLLLMVDHAPAAGGQVGQVIAFTHDPDEITYVAPDFPTFLQESLRSIDADPEEFLEIGF
ncbi:hypothetical protein VQ02_16375 [Methylobacterium variabile]|uniref:Knr4/Smi1-like domain-containing protein n=1 Tax=Methylobacterium variabile TaxID=298794 RepID=A0A0J6SL69_9HYPH|nr:SMI1/KNR4 family protein [Methylobacterium variabile]KMO35965.1 hypothetical protein VQ02_16375 [Methylobacterium variabile]